MKQIVEMIVGEKSEIPFSDFKKREAVRAIILDKHQNIALAYVSNGDYYKIPGGGVDEGESFLDALVRECREEAGVIIKDIQELGFISEINNFWNQHQISYCYTAVVNGKKKEPTFTEKELREGFELRWIPKKDVISIMKNTQPVQQAEQHMKNRDILFVKEFIKRKKL